MSWIERTVWIVALSISVGLAYWKIYIEPRRRRALPRLRPQPPDCPPLEEFPIEIELPDPRSLKVPMRFESSREHLDLELRYVEFLVRGAVYRWFHARNGRRAEDDWGSSTIDSGELQAFMSSKGLAANTLDVPYELEEFYSELAVRKDEIRASRSASRVALQFDLLARRLELTAEEEEALLATILPSIDSTYRRLYARLQDFSSFDHPTPELVSRIISGPPDTSVEPLELFATGGALLRHRILELDPSPDSKPSPLTAPVRLDPHVLEWLRWCPGDEDDARLPVDPRLAGAFRGDHAPLSLDRLLVGDATLAAVEALRAEFDAERTAHRIGSVFLFGALGSGRRDVARCLAEAASCRVLELDVRSARALGTPWRDVVTLAFREARLRAAFLLWHGTEALDEAEESEADRAVLLDAAERFAGVTVFAGETAWIPRGRFQSGALVRLGVPAPSIDLRRRIWNRVLPDADRLAAGTDRQRAARDLARGFQLNPGQCEDAVRAGLALALRDPESRGGRVSVAHLEAGCRQQAARRLRNLATHLAPRAGLSLDDELVLPAGPLRQLEELGYRIRHRSAVHRSFGFDQRYRLGQGLLALFTGPSGTGKTLAAEVLASVSGRDLFQVDMSRVVSKWVGETEKNLARIFAEATDSNAILFFDEADSLFGKRSEVRDARDRWANQEVNYLLQRVEQYSGVVIMATNLEQNMDPAFKRRIQVIVTFPFPSASVRKLIWEKILDAGIIEHTERGTAYDDLVEELSRRFELSGGQIRNAVVDASFRAHRRGGKRAALTRDDVFLSVALEYKKLGLPLSRGAFGAKQLERIMAVVYGDDATEELAVHG